MRSRIPITQVVLPNYYKPSRLNLPRQQLDEGSDLPFFQLWGLIAEKIYLDFFKTDPCLFPEAPDEALPSLLFTFHKANRAPPVC